MKFETLKNGSRKKLFIGMIVIIVLTITLIFIPSFAKYKTTQTIKLAEGKITYKPYDFKIMAMYQENDSGEYEEINVMPTSGYIINEEKSYCTLDNINKDNDSALRTVNGLHTFSGLKKNSKCYLWFDVNIGLNIQKIISDNVINNGTPNFANTSCSGICDEATIGMYTAEDDDGTTYYYRGDVTNNYVKFANLFWRIIRVNGDGSIRMIYDGLTARENGTSSTYTQVTTNRFNPGNTDNMYVGYMYTSGVVHGHDISSTMKDLLETWYINHIENNFGKYIDTDAGFCNDRDPYTNLTGETSGGGTGGTLTQYAARIRLYTNKTPSFKCNNSNDLFTVANSNKGNKALTKPIGLITADEVAYAGAVISKNNTIFYLYTGQNYWTMSPYHGNYIYADQFTINTNGALSNKGVETAYGVRPVINLRSDITFSGGDGTINSPYTIE